MPEQEQLQRAPAAPLVPVGLVGKHPVFGLADGRTHARLLVVRDLAVSVNADGANGITKASPLLARQLGLYVSPGATEVPLAAYHPDDWGNRIDWLPRGRAALGLDAPESGGKRVFGRNEHDEETVIYRKAYGFLLDENGLPYVQRRTDPAPGYYMSPTALFNPTYAETDARRWVDSASVPGFVLPGHDLAKFGVQLGDLAYVTYQGVGVWVQAYDSGNSGHLLELSVAACLALGMPACARSGGVSGGVDINIYPGSGTELGWMPGTAKTISAAGPRALLAAGLDLSWN